MEALHRGDLFYLHRQALAMARSRCSRAPCETHRTKVHSVQRAAGYCCVLKWKSQIMKGLECSANKLGLWRSQKAAWLKHKSSKDSVLASIYKTGGKWLFGSNPLRFCGQTSDFFLPAFIQHIFEPGSVLGARDTALNQAGEVSACVCVTPWHALKIRTRSEALGGNKNNAKS